MIKLAYYIRCVRLLVHLTWAPVMMGVFVGRNPAKRSRLDWWFINKWNKDVCNILGLRLHITGEPAKVPCLVVSNHISWHDIVVIQSRIKTGFVGKMEIRSWWLIGWLAYRGNTLFIRRGKRDSTQIIREAMAERLADNQCVGLFPESTTGTGDEIKRFRSRLFAPAIEGKLPIQPVTVYYRGAQNSCSEIAFINTESFFSHIMRTLKEPHIDVYIHFSDLIHTQGNEDRKELGLKTENIVREQLSILKKRADTLHN